MDIKFNIPNKKYPNNKITRTTNNLCYILALTVITYFCWNYENIYFLGLGTVQLSTLFGAPKELSPTGPYSTIIPLIVCVIFELIKSVCGWYKNYKLDFVENNRLIECHNHGNIKSSELYPGYIIKLYKNDIVPVDGILIDSSDKKYAKTSTCLLTGESHIHYIEKIDKLKTVNDYTEDHYIKIKNYYPKDLQNIDGTLSNSIIKTKFNGSNFVVSGSIVVSEEIYLWIVGCGITKKSACTSNNIITKKSHMDKHIANYMTNINMILLVVLVLISSIYKTYCVTNDGYIRKFILTLVQNWILFNGIIPFSVKILLLLTRNVQSIIFSKNDNIKINNSLLMDELCNVDKIVSDKTGTLTNNELEFSIIGYNNDGLHVDDINNIENINNINIELIKCLGLCIHVNDDNVFSTVEDKIIRYKYSYLNSHITKINNDIIMEIGDNQYKYKYVEITGIDFSYTRKMSSKFVKTNDGDYYIYCKGSLDVIKQKLLNDNKEILENLDNLITQKNPSLRLLGCAYRKINTDEMDMILSKQNTGTSFSMGTSSNTHIEQLENQLIFLGIVGIIDNIQEGVVDIINKFNQNNVFTSICTGDRKITALEIAKQTNIIIDNYIEINMDTVDFDISCKDKTMIFNGQILSNLNNDSYDKFCDKLVQSRNFVAYNLIPEDKSKLVSILQKQYNVLSIGDGFNDVPMFYNSNLSVAINRNQYVSSQADFSINNFKDLEELVFGIGANSYIRNSLFGNFTFYRCSSVITCILLCYLLNINETNIIFSGFVLQGFNFAWCIAHIASYVLNNKYNILDDIKFVKDKKYTNNKITSIWNINGFLTGLLISVTTNYYYGMDRNIICFVLIILLNAKLLFHNCNNVKTYLATLIGPILFLIYTLFDEGFLNTIIAVTNYTYLMNIIIGFIVINKIF